jgi:hypothetical protein
MNNGEKYKDKIIEEYQNLLKEKVIDGDGNRMNRAIKEIAYKYCGMRLLGASSTFEWLFDDYKEQPIKLTRLEYLLLKLFYEKDFRYLTRSAGGFLYMNKGNNPPQKKDGMWFNCESYITYDVINDLFQFVQWKDEQPKSIKKILNNCEVFDNEDN